MSARTGVAHPDAEGRAGQAAARQSYLAAALFVGLFVAFGAQLPLVVTGLLGVAAHVALFPVVATAAAPGWARAGAYGWIVIDTALNVIGMNVAAAELTAGELGVVRTIVDTMRLGIHVSAALWIAAVSWRASGAVRPVGLALASILGGYSLVAPWVPMGVYSVAFVLMPVWLALLGRYLGGSSIAVGVPLVGEPATA